MTQITVLSPLDLKPGAKNPHGQIVKTATLYIDKKNVVADVKYTDGGSAAFMWPSGSGWTVDGQVAP